MPFPPSLLNNNNNFNMDKLKSGAVAMSIVLFCLFLVFFSAFASGNQQQLHNKKEGKGEVLLKKASMSTSTSTSVLERVKSLFSLSTSTPTPIPTTTAPSAAAAAAAGAGSTSSSSSYWNKAQTLFNQLQTYFFPPNLDFRGREEVEVKGGGGGAGEKLKEAAAKSFEKSKATVEDSAKSTAKLAEETLRKTAQKVKKSLPHNDDRAEL